MHIGEAQERLDWSRPAILTGAVDEWPHSGGSSWAVEKLLAEYGSEGFVIGAAEPEADEPREAVARDQERPATRMGSYGTDAANLAPITMTLEDYLQYANRQHDDAPLYIFDDVFLDCPPGLKLANTFRRPSCFQEDFMSALGEDRPPHRWLLLGPARAGTALHVDPLETSAWNTLVSGHKRWVLFPPVPRGGSPHDQPRQHPCPDTAPDIDDSSSHWMHSCYSTVDLSAWECIDVVQGPGETIYVPNGWWHNVVNLDFTVAVTENFVGSLNLQASFRAMQASDPELAEQWRAGLEAEPSLRKHAATLPP